MIEGDPNKYELAPNEIPRTVTYPDHSMNHVWDRLGQVVKWQKLGREQCSDPGTCICVSLDASREGGSYVKLFVIEGTDVIRATRRPDGLADMELLTPPGSLISDIMQQDLTVGARYDVFGGNKVTDVSVLDTLGHGGDMQFPDESGTEKNPLVVARDVWMQQTE